MFDSSTEDGREVQEPLCALCVKWCPANSRLKLKMHKVCAIIYKDVKARVTSRKLRQSTADKLDSGDKTES